MADENRHENRSGWWGGLSGGLVVIAIGLVFLLRNLGIQLPFAGLHNWWALFILVGAVPPLLQAINYYRQVGKLDHMLLCLLLSATAPVLVAAFFLLDLDWSVWWPLFVIYGGLWMVAGMGKRKTSPH